MSENYFMTNESNGKVNISIGDFVPNSAQTSREWSILISPEQAQEFALMILAESFKAKKSPNYEAPEYQKTGEKDLFNWGKFKLHSGDVSKFKIECDTLSNISLRTIAELILQRCVFFDVIGVPDGGLALAHMLKSHRIRQSNQVLIVDDVLTTGKSITEKREELRETLPSSTRFLGIVIFARGECPDWVEPIFKLTGKEKFTIKEGNND